jgi:lipopolysaccharide biosynthesis glycosyltransferase
VQKNRARLILPDQDIINALYAKQIKNLDEKFYNYDARYFSYYKLTSNGYWHMEHVIRNTVILHFCGKKKPWKKDYSGKFHSLYKHYEKLALPQAESGMM